jgi:hypothetical protein
MRDQTRERTSARACALLLVLLGSAGLTGCRGNPPPPYARQQALLIGRWEWGGDEQSDSLTFSADGTFRLVRRETLRRPAQESVAEGEYRLVGEHTIELRPGDGPPTRHEFSFSDDESTLSLGELSNHAVWHRTDPVRGNPTDAERAAQEAERQKAEEAAKKRSAGGVNP